MSLKPKKATPQHKKNDVNINHEQIEYLKKIQPRPAPAPPSAPAITPRELKNLSDVVYLDPDITLDSTGNHPRLAQTPTLINAFKQARCHNISNYQDALKNFAQLKKEERRILSEQALAIQVMCDLVIDDPTSYTLRSSDVLEHRCQGKIVHWHPLETTIHRRCNQLCMLKNSVLPFLHDLDTISAGIQMRQTQIDNDAGQFESVLDRHNTRDNFILRYSKYAQALVNPAQIREPLEKRVHKFKSIIKEKSCASTTQVQPYCHEIKSRQMRLREIKLQLKHKKSRAREQFHKDLSQLGPSTLIQDQQNEDAQKQFDLLLSNDEPANHVKKVTIRRKEFKGYEFVCKLADARRILSEIHKQHILRDAYSYTDSFLTLVGWIIEFLRSLLKNAYTQTIVHMISPDTLRYLNDGTYDLVVEDLHKRTSEEKPLKFRIHYARDKFKSDKAPGVQQALGLATLSVQIAFLLRDALKQRTKSFSAENAQLDQAMCCLERHFKRSVHKYLVKGGFGFFHFRNRHLRQCLMTTRERLDGLKSCALHYARCAKTFVRAKEIFKTTVRNVAEQGQDEELAAILDKDQEMRTRAWLPGVVRTIGRYYLRMPRLFKKAYYCEDSQGELCHIESSSWASGAPPSINEIDEAQFKKEIQEQAAANLVLSDPIQCAQEINEAQDLFSIDAQEPWFQRIDIQLKIDATQAQIQKIFKEIQRAQEFLIQKNQFGGLAQRIQHRASKNSSIKNIAQWQDEVQILNGICSNEQRKLVQVEIKLNKQDDPMLGKRSAQVHRSSNAQLAINQIEHKKLKGCASAGKADIKKLQDILST